MNSGRPLLSQAAAHLGEAQRILHSRRYLRRGHRWGSRKHVVGIVAPNYGEPCPRCGFQKSKAAEVCWSCSSELRRKLPARPGAG